jgi:PAS domain S-box-containing protein
VHALGELGRDRAGEPVRIAGTALDITERRHAESALRMLSLAIEQSSESIVITGLDGRIEYVNDAFVRASGYPRSEVLGRNSRLLQSGKTPPETYRAMWAALVRGQQWRGEFHNRRKDGSEYLEAALIGPLRQADGTISNYVAVKADISEKRRTEQELEQYQHRLEELVEERTAQLKEARRQAEAANEAKSVFLANMSHEIRTPMNGVLGMAELLEHSHLSDEQTDLVRTIRESGMALVGIIDDILDFSKIEARRLTFDEAPVSVADVAERLCDSLLPVAVRKRVDLSVFVSPDIPELVLTDDVRLRQMLYNLVGNAIKFSGGRSEKRGRVRLRVSVAAQAPLRLAFAVTDNGIGMSEQTIASLFTPFLQGEASTTRRYGGSGLGLTICKRLADLMHGEIAVASRLGEGSIFTLTLPVKVPGDQPARMLPDLGGLHCVVLESAAIDVDGICAYLAHAGARVHRAGSASDCARVAAGLTGLVVALRDAGDEKCSEAESSCEAAPNLRHVVIKRGKRRGPRVEAPNIVSLDSAGLRRLALLQAVAIAAGRASPEIAREHVSRVAPARPAVADGPRLILVAEDDEVNRRVINTQLRLLGHTAEIARDGAEALRMWREGRYALLLTDLHMPVMDGYELTAAIRLEEAARASPPPRMPIAALTANALRGEAERAKSAGIDDYLTKPLQLDVLRKTLERWLRSADPPSAPATDLLAPPAAPARAAFDIGVLKVHVGDDPATLRDLLGHFLSNARHQAAELRRACAGSDAAQAAAIAHKLKSSARSVGALALGELCAEIERTGRAGDFDALAGRALSFDAALSDIEAEIASVLATRDA